MSSTVVLITVIVALVTMTFGRRLPFPFAALAALAAFGLMFGVGLAEDRVTLVVVAGLVPLPVFGFRIPFVSDGGGRRGDDAPHVARPAATVGEPARYVTGVLASRWPRGELKLTGTLLHFLTDEGDEAFRVNVAEIDRLRFSSTGRAQLTIRTLGGARHAVAFGRHGLARGELGAAQTFWRETIEARQANPGS